MEGGGRVVCVGKGRRLGLLRMDMCSAGVRVCAIRLCPQFSFHYFPRGAFGVGKEGERGLALKHTNLAALPVHFLLRLLLLAMCSSTSG